MTMISDMQAMYEEIRTTIVACARDGVTEYPVVWNYDGSMQMHMPDIFVSLTWIGSEVFGSYERDDYGRINGRGIGTVQIKVDAMNHMGFGAAASVAHAIHANLFRVVAVRYGIHSIGDPRQATYVASGRDRSSATLDLEINFPIQSNPDSIPSSPGDRIASASGEDTDNMLSFDTREEG